jgi:hypothetical protein
MDVLKEVDEHVDRALDQALAMTFPASDPVAVFLEFELAQEAGAPPAKMISSVDANGPFR